MSARRAKVFLVGAGPGDPGLLTRRAFDLLAAADVVAVDALVSPAITALIPSSATVIQVGKRAGAHSLPQAEINALLVREARSGKSVVRLKGGDPFVFGRGGEEAEDLAAAGIPFEIVPGITAAIAGPAYAGIAVTHRALSNSLTIVTGHESEETSGLNWEALANLRGTIVFLMGLGNLGTIAKKLIDHGMAADAPAAVIANATRPDQRVVSAPLSEIEAEVTAASLVAPALVIVGEVVRLRERIEWFEKRPLFGKRIVVTRAREQASGLAQLLEESGAIVLQFPAIEITAPASFVSLDQAIESLGREQWVVFSSTNGVRSYLRRLLEQGRDVRAFGGTKIAAVGERTAEALRDYGILPDLVPDRFQSNALLPFFEGDQKGVTITVVRAADGNDDFLEKLRRRGATVHLAVAYENRIVENDLTELERLVAEEAIDVVTFTSGSTVTNFFRGLDETSIARLARRALFASIGPVTTAALAKLGLHASVEAPAATVQALHDALIERMTRT